MTTILDKAALKGIECYKTRISPLKGWKCAYAVTYGISCSSVAENLINEHGVMKARPLIKQQFQECQAEFEKLKAEQENKQSSNQSCDTNTHHGCDVPFWGCGSLPSRGSSRGSSSCDIDGCGDIGGCDF